MRDLQYLKNLKSLLEKISKKDNFWRCSDNENIFISDGFILFKISSYLLDDIHLELIKKIEFKDRLDLCKKIYDDTYKEGKTLLDFNLFRPINNRGTFYFPMKKLITLDATIERPDYGPLFNINFFKDFKVNTEINFYLNKDYLKASYFKISEYYLTGLLMPVKYKINDQLTLSEKLNELF